LFVGAHGFLFFGVRFTRAANSKPARQYTGLDNYNRQSQFDKKRLIAEE